MFNWNLLYEAKVVRVANAAAAGTTTVTTSVVDMQGYNSVAYIVLLGDVTATSVLTLTGKTNSANSTSGAAVAASTTTVTWTADATNADNNVLVLDLNKPRQRYSFATLDRATANAAVDGILAVLYNAAEHPVTQPATVIASAFAADSV